MQFFLFCFFVTGVICLILGLRKSNFGPIGASRQHCTLCGWTKEKVQLCQLRQHHTIKVTPVCLDCSMKYDAVPVRGASVEIVRAACG
jgi:hypothetical protein